MSPSRVFTDGNMVNSYQKGFSQGSPRLTTAEVSQQVYKEFCITEQYCRNKL
jgi:hypothetical protein